MSSIFPTTVRGVLHSLFSHLMNPGRDSGNASQAQPGPASQTTPAAPDSAVRFDFAEPTVPAPTAEQPAAAPLPVAAPLAAADPVAAAAPVPPAAPQAPAPLGASVPLQAALPSPEPARSAVTASNSTPARSEAPATAVPRTPAPLDDEAQARAWAVQSLAREKMLGMVARLAERPDGAGAEAARKEPSLDGPAPEPKTLALA